MSMGKEINVLLIEDVEDDAVLVIYQLKQEGYNVFSKRVDQSFTFKAALAEHVWDIIISDHNMPGFSSTEARSILKESGLDIPFILVSGTVGEEFAVSAMKAGANDYLMKGNLSRLGPAVEREIKEAKVRREKREIENALIESNKRFNRLMSELNDVAWTSTLDGSTILDVNKSFESVFELPIEEYKKNPRLLMDIVHPNDRAIVQVSAQELLKKGNSETEYRIIKPNGTIVWLLDSKSIIYDEDGNPVQMGGIIKDITERKLAEEKLRESEETLKEAQHIGRYGYWNYNINTGKSEYSENYYRLFGYEPFDQALSSDDFKSKVYHDDLHKVNEGFRLVQEEKQRLELEIRIVKKDQNIACHSWIIEPKFQDGKLVFLHGTAQDITERKKAEENLKKKDKLLAAIAEAFYELLSNNSIDAAIQNSLGIMGNALDVERVTIFKNHQDKLTQHWYSSLSHKWLSTNSEQLTNGHAAQNYPFSKFDDFFKPLKNNKPFEGIVSKLPNSILKAIFQSVNIKSVLAFPIFIKDYFWGFVGFDEKKYERVWYESEFTILQSYSAAIASSLERFYRKEELRKAKEKAEKTDKLKTEFLAQMSHEIRTPINVISNFTSLIEDYIDFEKFPEANDDFKIITNAGNRLIRTVDQILNMSELQTGNYKTEFKEVDIFQGILEPIYREMKSMALDKGLLFEVINSTDRTVVKADEYSIAQIFFNLIDNAIKYTEKGEIKILIKSDVKDKLVVSVQDTGIGIGEEYLPELFNPFRQEQQGYTRQYEGNGLGLALVKKYCELNNAEIEVQSRKSAGSVFSVSFNQT